MITSFIPGRIRFRNAGLKNAAAMNAFKAKVQEMPGFSSLESNPATGSVTAYYMSDNGDKTRQARWLRDVLPEMAAKYAVNKPRDRARICRTRGYYRFLILTYALCMASPSLGLMSAHRYSAFVLTGLLARHVYDYRRRIF